MNKKKIALIIIAVIVFLLTQFQGVSAQSALPMTVFPARQTLHIDPNTTERTKVSFFNQADIPIAGNIKIVDFIVKDNSGSPYLLDKESDISNKYSAASWIKPNINKAVIAANTILKVQLTITAPKDAAPGGRYAAIYFEPTGTLPNTKAFINQKKGIQGISPRLAALIYIRVNGPISEEAVIKKLSVPNFIEYGPVEIEAEILNNGSYHISPKGKIVLTNWKGKVIDQYNLTEINIFPEKSRIYKASLGPRTMIGKYRVSFLAVYGDSNQNLSASQTFWAFPIRLFLMIILTIIIIILLAVLIWKKLKKRQKKIEEKLEAEVSELEELKKKYKDNPPVKSK